VTQPLLHRRPARHLFRRRVASVMPKSTTRRGELRRGFPFLNHDRLRSRGSRKPLHQRRSEVASMDSMHCPSRWPATCLWARNLPSGADPRTDNQDRSIRNCAFKGRLTAFDRRAGRSCAQSLHGRTGERVTPCRARESKAHEAPTRSRYEGTLGRPGHFIGGGGARCLPCKW